VSNTEIIAKVNNLMQQGFEVPAEKLIPTATVFGDLGLDSLDAVDMLVNLEDRLGVKVDVEKLKGIRTLQDVYNLVSDLTSQNMPVAPVLLQEQVEINQ
jgi:acyl carrier protein